MLRHLDVRDFVIVDKVTLEFNGGFTVLTGETGAGKSILVGALSLLLGERGDAAVVRAGCERAELTAEFDISCLPPLSSWLEKNDLSGDLGICLMRRVVEANGRSRAYINGRPATLQQLREAGEWLVDIHGQHTHQSLLKADAQRDLLDGYAGLHELSGTVSAAYRQWQRLYQQRLAREKNNVQSTQEREQLEWQIRELAALNFNAQEWQDILSNHARLAHVASLAEGAQLGLALLSENEMSALSQVNTVNARLNDLIEYDAGLKEMVDILASTEAQLQETVYSLRHYLQRLDTDPERLQAVEQRLEAIHSAARKYRVSAEQLPERLSAWQARFAELGGSEDEAELARQEDTSHAAYLQAAQKLSSARQKTAKTLSQKVTATMQKLAMAGAKFVVSLNALPQGNAHGLEQVEFLVTAHAGLEPQPLAKVASGGEISRISLAIQAETSKVAGVPTLIFDEVDVGIGGGVAEIVGNMLLQLGQERQVLCITHLPQVAALGDHHWQVSKQSRNGSALSRIANLEPPARIEEIARMLGGIEITETTRRHAAEMLGVD